MWSSISVQKMWFISLFVSMQYSDQIMMVCIIYEDDYKIKNNTTSTIRNLHHLTNKTVSTEYEYM